MGIEEHKKRIITLVETSQDMDYIVALCSFAESYPDKSKAETNHE